MTRLRRSSLEPDSWSAAVSRNLSVLVAEGRMASVEDFSGSLSAEAMTDVCRVVLILVSVLGGDAVAPLEPNEVDGMNEGATVAGGVKKVPSSRVSRKSLCQILSVFIQI